MKNAHRVLRKRLLVLILGAAGAAGCASHAGQMEPCSAYTVPEHALKYKVQDARIEVQWHEEWVSRFGEKLPEPLPPQQNWQHPILSGRYAGTMHEDSQATDVSDFAGPTPNNTRVSYFHVLEKGKRLTGMAPVYTFLDDKTLISIAFGRDAATLLVVDVTGEPVVLDQVDIPGRGSKMRDLMKKSGRMAIFRDTSGGAYSYLDAKGDMYVPGANNTIIRIPIRNRRIQRDQMVYLNLGQEVAQGTIVEAILSKDPQENKLTAILPDASGRVWFTSKYGVVGVIDPSERTEDDCPKIYATAIQLFAADAKIRKMFDPLPEGGEAFLRKLEEIEPGESIDDFPAIRKEFRELFLQDDKGFSEQIQNSFSVGRDGIFLLSNVALYKLRFNDKTKKIELDPKWAPTYAEGDLIYDNDHKIKPGHLNDGSGTTPTLVGDDHVVIVDNAPDQLHLMAYDQKNGALVSKVPIFDPGKGAVENSVVAYGKNLIVGNTYGYVDPFAENPTPGGIARIDFDEATGEYARVEGWPATGHFDAKTATPKLSTAHGLIYVYHRDMPAQGYHDWQLTALDFRTGWRVFSLKGYFEKKEFDDNVNVFVKRGSLGKEDYDRKVFNNLWGTFTFGPGNSVFIGAYRGFVRFSSDREP